ncbi:hypothetical protein Tco_0021632, partial [Tanacetum coccineum]
LRVAKLEKDVSELKKKITLLKLLLISNLKFQRLLIVILDPNLSASEIHKIKREQAEKQKMPKYTIKSTDKATLKEYALIEDENAMDKGFADTIKNHIRQHNDDEDDDDDDEDPSTGPN